MKIYIVMIDDRHTDTEPFPFADADAAVAWAKAQVREYARREQDIEEESIGGWLYYARYSPEGDSVWVVEKDLEGSPVAAVPRAHEDLCTDTHCPDFDDDCQCWCHTPAADRDELHAVAAVPTEETPKS